MKNVMKKVSILILSVCLAFSGIIPGQTEKAAAAGNTTYSTAETCTLSTTYSGAITDNGDSSLFWKVTLPTSGKITVSGSAYMEYINMYVYDDASKELIHEGYSWNSTNEIISINNSYFLASGTYYINFSKRYSATGEFNFKVDFESTGETFLETNGGINNTMQTASDITIGATLYTAQLAINDDKDFYKFSLPTSTSVTLTGTFYNMKYVYCYVYDSAGKEVYKKSHYWNSVLMQTSVNETLTLSAGTYYLAFGEQYDYDGKYTFSLNSGSGTGTLVNTTSATNNDYASAAQINLGQTYNGQIAVNDYVDFFKFTVPETTRLVVNVNSATMSSVSMYIYDSTSRELTNEYQYKDSVTGKVTISKVYEFSAGTYYIAIKGSSSNTGSYTLNVSLLTADNHVHDYVTTYVAATYFKKGYTLHTCKYCGASYKDNFTPKKKLTQPSLYGRTKGTRTYSGAIINRKAYVYWYKNSDASGYELKYSTSKKFKKSKTKKLKFKKNTKTSCTIKLPSSKRYYFKVRAYKKKGKKKVYSKWSPKRWTTA